MIKKDNFKVLITKTNIFTSKITSPMPKITFTCETITPMFIAGADGETPELRAPSIKGALRFWWRALNGHLSLKELKEREGQIFGSTEQRSRVIIRVIEPLKYEQVEAAMLPHKIKDKSYTPCFKEKKSFKVQFSLPEAYLNPIKNLFILTTILGGFGKRSRRGFGSVKITAIDEITFTFPNNISSIYNYLNPNFFCLDNDNDKITIRSKNQQDNKYPYIKSIELGKKSEKYLLKDIIEASHKVKKKEYDRAKKEAEQKKDFFYKRNGEQKPNEKKYSYFESSIGDGAKRLASPIYVSCLINTVPIITTLNHVPFRGKSEDKHIELQEQFKEKLV